MDTNELPFLVAEIKVCTRCGETKPKTRDFFFYQRSEGQRRSGRGFRQPCRDCIAFANKSAKDRERLAKGLPITRRGKSHDLARKKAASAAWRKRNPDKIAAAKKRMREREPEKAAAAVLRQTRRRNLQIKNDPTLNLHYKISRGVRSSISAGKDGRSWPALVGYTAADLRRHIERQFTKGMSWDAYRRGEIHIDHIRPVSMFRFSTPDDPEFKDCWALTNLRPLWAPDNISKNAKRTHLI